MANRDLVPVGELPPLGHVPARMHAQVIRSERMGKPRDAFRVEVVDTPVPAPGQVLVAVMAAGINYNNVWAARGVPINVIKVRQRRGDPRDYHVGGSDASGIVYAVGENVRNVTVGDEVVIHHGWWSLSDPWVLAGRDPMLAPSSDIWGYGTNDGSFAQFALANASQCMPKAPHLTWEQAGCNSLVGATAYRMLHGWAGNEVSHGDVVLVWGGSGGLGSQAIQLARHAGATPVAVVSSAARGEYCGSVGAAGWINRNDYSHWGIPPHWADEEGQARWTAEARRFQRAIWEVTGERRDPAIVFEHPGETTIPTSAFVCAPGGMVVICAGTTGYSAMVDLRHHWVKQKRLQGSHGTSDSQAYAYNDLVASGAVDPCLGDLGTFEEIPVLHERMAEGALMPGNAAALVGIPEPGHGAR